MEPKLQTHLTNIENGINSVICQKTNRRKLQDSPPSTDTSEPASGTPTTSEPPSGTPTSTEPASGTPTADISSSGTTTDPSTT